MKVLSITGKMKTCLVTQVKNFNVINDFSTVSILMMVHGLLSYYQHSTHCHILQVKKVPFSVREMFYHSMSTVAVRHNCAWLMGIGQDLTKAVFVLLDLSK